MAQGGPVRFETAGRVARITLDRPPLHILDAATVDALGEAVARVTRTPGIVVTVIAATGDKAFSSGVDIKDHVPEKAAAMIHRFHAVIRAVRALECVTVAAVRGVALGGGFELALTCDMIVAEEGSSCGAPEIWLACFPPVGAAVLPRHIAPQKAAEIVLSGQQITADEAAQMGLVNLVVPPGGMEGALDRYVSLFTEKSAAALRIAKRALRAGEEMPFTAALSEAEGLYLEELLKTEDAAEGVRAYLEKREPKWKDR
jgi:cyclohexa-1,5-dienecarbonyl-CoA hydratase